MEKSSKIIIVALVAALAIVSASLAAALAMTVSNSQINTEVISSADESFLYVQHASSGTIESENDSSTAAIYKLTLNGVYNNTMSFSDRPDRKVDQITTARYVHLWTKGQDSFAADPPNAALVMNEAGGSEAIVVVELLNPVYDSEKQTLAYDIVALNPKEGLLSFGSSASLPDSFGQATLFIDNAYDGNCDPEPNADLRYCKFSKVDLAGANLHGADLSFAFLRGADLEQVDLAGANLSFADLTGADLTNANLSSANLEGTDFSSADLTGANLTGADLIAAGFCGTRMPDGSTNNSGCGDIGGSPWEDS